MEERFCCKIVVTCVNIATKKRNLTPSMEAVKPANGRTTRVKLIFVIAALIHDKILLNLHSFMHHCD